MSGHPRAGYMSPPSLPMHASRREALRSTRCRVNISGVLHHQSSCAPAPDDPGFGAFLQFRPFFYKKALRRRRGSLPSKRWHRTVLFFPCCGDGMFNERGNGQFHIQIQRKRPYRGMKFLKTVSLPNAAGVSRAHWAPDAAYCASFNEFKGACMLPLTQLLFQFRRSIGRNGYLEVN